MPLLRSRPVKLKALFFLLLLAAAAYAAWRYLPREVAAATTSGTIETDEVHVASRYGGRVEKVFVQEGDVLTNGQPILELAADELRAHHQLASAQLAELSAGPRPQEIAAAKSEWEAHEAELELARSEEKRARDLFKQNTISATELDRAASRAATLEKGVAAAQHRLDLLRAGTRPERIAQATAQVAVIAAQLREMRISAPTNCVLEVLNVKPGDVLPPNREAARLILPHYLWLRVFVPQPQLGRLRTGQAVRVKTDAFPEKSFHGEIEQLNRSAEFTPRNAQTAEERIKKVFGVKIRLTNEDGWLKAGMSADVEFEDAGK